MKPEINFIMLNIVMIHFYCFKATKTILISDLPVEKIRSKFGYGYEIINSIKDNSYLDQIKERTLRSYLNYTVEELYKKPKWEINEEQRRKISESKLGKPRPPEVRARISAALKGRSNFQGKSHSDDTKARMATRKLGNTHTKDYFWAHDPNGDKEVRVRSRAEIPYGFRQGRDYYSTEAGLYYFIKNNTPE